MRDVVALDQAFDYVDAVVNADISRVDGVSRDPARVRRLLRSYARLQGSQSTIPNIRKDMTTGDRCGPKLIEEGAKTLNELSGLIDTSRQREVAFKMVITATGDTAYQRTDGVYVCPLSSLRP